MMISKDYNTIINETSNNRLPMTSNEDNVLRLNLGINKNTESFLYSQVNMPKSAFSTRFDFRPNTNTCSNKQDFVETKELFRWQNELTDHDKMMKQIQQMKLNPDFAREIKTNECQFEKLSDIEKLTIVYHLIHKIPDFSQLKFLSKVINDCLNSPSIGSNSNPDDLSTPKLFPLDKAVDDLRINAFSDNRKAVNRPTSINTKNITLSELKSNWQLNTYRSEIKSANFWKNSASEFIRKQPSSAKLIDPTWGIPVSPFVLKNSGTSFIKKDNSHMPKSVYETKILSNTNTKPTYSYALKAKSNLSSPCPIAKVTVNNQTRSSFNQDINKEKDTILEGSGSFELNNNIHCTKTHNPIPIDFRLLNNVPAWMKSLRLHKYTPVFGDMKWRDIICLNEEQLSNLGVNTVGARRKMLRVFETVKQEAKLKNIEL